MSGRRPAFSQRPAASRERDPDPSVTGGVRVPEKVPTQRDTAGCQSPDHGKSTHGELLHRD